jgi:hypothetical protein
VAREVAMRALIGAERPTVVAVGAGPVFPEPPGSPMAPVLMIPVLMIPVFMAAAPGLPR